MADGRISMLEIRLERIERRNRILFIVIVAILCAGLFGFAAQREIPELIRAKQFELVNEAGAVRAVWAGDDRETLLRFNDEKGAPRVKLGLLQAPPFPAVQPRKGVPKPLFSTTVETPALWFRGLHNNRVSLAAHNIGSALLLSEEGATRLRIVVQRGEPSIELFDENANVVRRISSSGN